GTYLAVTLPRRLHAAPRLALPAPGVVFAHRMTLLTLAVGVVGGLLAMTRGAWSPGAGLGAVGLLSLGWGVLLHRGPGRPVVAWAACGAAVFGLLLAGVHQGLPHYHRKFGLRGQVRRHADLAT